MRPEFLSALIEYEFSAMVALAKDGFDKSGKRWFSNKNVWDWLLTQSDLERGLFAIGLSEDRAKSGNFYRSFAIAMREHGLFVKSRTWVGGSLHVSVWDSEQTFRLHLLQRPQPARGVNRYNASESKSAFDKLHEWRPWE